MKNLCNITIGMTAGHLTVSGRLAEGVVILAAFIGYIYFHWKEVEQ